MPSCPAEGAAKFLSRRSVAKENPCAILQVRDEDVMISESAVTMPFAFEAHGLGGQESEGRQPVFVNPGDRAP